MANLDDLAFAAMDAERWTDALGHAQDALALDARDGQESQRLYRLVEILLRMGRCGDAVKAARNGTLAGAPSGTPPRRRSAQNGPRWPTC